MKVQVKVPPSPYRLLKERYFGEETRKPGVARSALERLCPRLHSDVASVVTEAVNSLMEYQDPDYALLYLDRIERYVGRAGAQLPNLGELAQLMSDRMHFEDPIRIAQLKLTEAGGANPVPRPGSTDWIERFRWDEVILMLPPNAAAPALDMSVRLRLAGLSRRTVKLRFSSSNRFALRRLKWTAALKITRPFSERFRRERAWVERWLHMIDRTLLKQPQAVVQVVRTANLIGGHGDAYHNGLVEWDAIINGLVKPVCDGTLPLPKLAESMIAVRQAGRGEQGEIGLVKTVERIRREVLAGM